MGHPVRNSEASVNELEKAVAILRQRGATDADIVRYVAEYRKATKTPESSTPGQQFGALAARGVTLGFAPKILGGIDAVNAMLPRAMGGESMPASGFGAKYTETRDRISRAADQGIAEHPVAGRAVEIGSGLATSLPVMGARVTASVARPALKGLARIGAGAMKGVETGAALGAAAGAGHATGGLKDYGQQMADGAAYGGLFGGAAGAIIPPVAEFAGNVGGRALTAIGARPTGRSAQEIADDLARMRAPKGPEAPMAQAMGNSAMPEPSAPQRIRARIGQAAEAAGIESSKTRALREIARRFELDNVTPENAEVFAKLHAGKPVAVLDLGHNNVADLARTSKDVPGLGKRIVPEFLHGRSAGVRGDEGQTLQRITGDFEKRIGLKPENYYQSVDEMTAEMKAAASSNYGKIRGHVIDDPEVLSLFDEPEFRAVHEAIRRNARIRKADPIAPLSEVGEIGGKVHTQQNPQTLGTLDKMKRHLDQIIGGKIDGGPIQRDAAYAMRERLSAALDRMDEIVPEYKAARSQYRGSAEAIDAFEQGRTDFLTLDPRLIQRKLAAMPERVQDLYRRGGYDALRGKLVKMKDGANIGGWLEENPDIRSRVGALAKKADDAELLRDDLGLERHMGTRKDQILGGPNTASRLIDYESTKAQTTEAGNAARQVPGLTGRVLGALADNTITRRAAGQTSEVMGEVGKIMTRSGPTGIHLTADEIRRLQMQDIVRQLQTRGKATTLGGLTGSQVGRDRP